MTNCRRALAVSVLLIICLSRLCWHASATTQPSDVTALNALLTAWSGGNSRMPDWTGNDPCGTNWQGVICGGSTGDRVTQLSLPNLNLTGPIPDAIGNLDSLTLLELSFNENMGGPLPIQLGLLTSLTSLSIMNSGLTGTIPSQLAQCVNLSFIALNQNQLTGPIPDVLGHLTELFWFDISQNQITGPLPVSRTSPNGVGLDNLTSAAHFHFNNNSIGGTIPPEIFNAPSLIHLLLNYNALTGSIPANVVAAKGLKILLLDGNFLQGEIPTSIGSMSTLTQFTIRNNTLTGPLPDLSLLTQLELLDLSVNNFAQQGVPAWMYSMSNVQTLYADSVNFNGTLDSSIFDLPSLETLSMTSNKLSGIVNFSGNSASSLVLIDLENNQFTGLNGNLLTNGVESNASLRLAGNPYCSALQQNNVICQIVSTSLSTWTPNTTSCKQTCEDGKILNYKVCGCFYPLVCDMQLTSPPFSTINTGLIDQITHEWATAFGFNDLQVVILSANFTTDKRMLFNLTFFPSSGEALDASTADNITSAITLQHFGSAEGPYILLGKSQIFPASTSKKSFPIGAIIGAVVAVILVAIVIALIVVYALRQKRRADKAQVSQPFASWGTKQGDPGAAPQLKGARWFSLLELKRATNNFSQDNEIGLGGYGTVYKAKLASGEVVAVKRAEANSMQGATEFKNEIELLSRVHHRNLVGLVGFCYESNEQMLVYEYMPNGTLRDHLLGLTDVPLNWESRVNLALGSAKGLNYLHEMANPPIIHRDIKSSNILLDDKMVAKVADFGLSKLAPDSGGKNHISTQVKGTLGYLDPEYYMTNQLSEKSDVYSFGVVLLEILSARQPIEQGRYIVREVRTALDKGGMNALTPLLDPFLGNFPQAQLEAVLDLALRCVEESANDRPTMSEVVKQLEVIAGRSQTNSGVHITVEPQKKKSLDLYDNQDRFYNENDDPSFQYSGSGFVLPSLEPK